MTYTPSSARQAYSPVPVRTARNSGGAYVPEQTGVLLLDEPTTYLGIAYQIEILDLVSELNRRRGTTVVMVLHDINLSSRYADHMFALRKGELYLEGAPDEVVTAQTMRDVFDLECEIIFDPVSGSPFVVPKGRCRIGE